MHDRVALRSRHEAGEPIRSIARAGPSRNAVRRAVAPGARDRYYRPSASEAVEGAVRDVLADYPHMTVEDIAVLVDWRLSRRALSDVVARIRPQFAEHDDLAARPITSIRAGTLAAVGALKVGRLQL